MFSNAAARNAFAAASQRAAGQRAAAQRSAAQAERQAANARAQRDAQIARQNAIRIETARRDATQRELIRQAVMRRAQERQDLMRRESVRRAVENARRTAQQQQQQRNNNNVRMQNNRQNQVKSVRNFSTNILQSPIAKSRANQQFFNARQQLYLKHYNEKKFFQQRLFNQTQFIKNKIISNQFFDKVRRQLQVNNERKFFLQKQITNAVHAQAKRTAAQLFVKMQTQNKAPLPSSSKAAPPTKRARVDSVRNPSMSAPAAASNRHMAALSATKAHEGSKRLSHSDNLLHKMDQKGASTKVHEEPKRLSHADSLLQKMDQKAVSSLPFFEASVSKPTTHAWESAPPPKHFNAAAPVANKRTHDQLPEKKQKHPKVFYATPPIPQKVPVGLSQQQKEKLSEDYARKHFAALGYTSLESKIGSSNGIDTFFVMKDAQKKIVSVAIVESKFRSNGKVRLDKTETKGVQMTHTWLHETLKIMEIDANPEVREAAQMIRKNGNAVLDSRFVNLMTPDGKVKWFQFIKKNYDNRDFDNKLDDGVSDGDVHPINEENILSLIRNWSREQVPTHRL